MAGIALAERRPWLLVSIAAAIAFYFLRDANIPGTAVIALKGAGVALLAIYAFLRYQSGEAKLLALALAFGAAGDMGVELSLEAGGALFFIQHIALIVLFLRHRRDSMTFSQTLTVLALLVATPLVSYFLSGQWTVGLYALGLGAMAASAWASRFSRYRVGLGAVMFVISDWLIFSELGSVDLSPWPELLIWPIYYAGQFLIATGVIQTLRHELPETN